MAAPDATAGMVYRIAPGHDGWVVGDQPFVAVEFQGAAAHATAPDADDA